MNTKYIVRILFVIAIIIAVKIYYLDIMNLTNKNYDIAKLTIDEKLDNSDVKNTGINKLSHFGLKTDTSKVNIDFDSILSGGPGKDGIPALDNPKFVNNKDTLLELDFLKEGSNGISVENKAEAKFYPYEILVWHEIVNDEIGDMKISVTFCPLCGSAIVYDRNIEGTTLEFGVSGLLYESNLLMYDKKTESLWSQSMGKSVVGDYLGVELDLVKSNLMSFSEFENKYPNGKIMSDDTGFNRSYGNIPYGDYDNNDVLYFPVGNEDLRFPKKEIFYIINHDGYSLAFLLKDLREKGTGEITVGNNTFEASFDKGIVDVKLEDEILKGYYEMWFSWVNHNIGNNNVWSVE